MAETKASIEIPSFVPDNRIVDLVEYLYMYGVCPYCHKSEWDSSLTSQDYYDHMLGCVTNFEIRLKLEKEDE